MSGHLSIKFLNSAARINVSKRFNRVSNGPWLLLNEGLRERLFLLEMISVRILNRIYG